MSIEKRIITEIQRIAELEDEGYEETDEPCEHCGTFLMMHEHEVFLPDMGDLIEVRYCCPHCGDRIVFYDS